MTDDDKPVEVEPLADEKIFAALGNDVRLIIAEQRDGTLRAYYPAFSSSDSYSKYAGISIVAPAAASVPPNVQTCINNGWSCVQQANGSWICKRLVGGRWYQKTIWP